MPPSSPPFGPPQLEALCRALADVYEGLTSSEIGQLLQEVGVADINRYDLPWRRLYNALSARQFVDRQASRILDVTALALDPLRHRDPPYRLQSMVNVALALMGLEYQQGEFRTVPRTAMLE